MKKITLFLIGIYIVSCSDKKTNQETENNTVSSDTIKYVPPRVTAFEIIPGERVGLTQLEENVEKLSELGKPDRSDSAMGKSWSTWISEDGAGDELNIYSTYKNSEMKEKVVHLIRVTSPSFKTLEEISTGNSLQDIQKTFSDIKLVAKYTDENTNSKVEIYDSEANGIAFEFTQNLCSAIIIHTKGKKVTEEYITLHPNMEKF